MIPHPHALSPPLGDLPLSEGVGDQPPGGTALADASNNPVGGLLPRNESELEPHSMRWMGNAWIRKQEKTGEGCLRHEM